MHPSYGLLLTVPKVCIALPPDICMANSFLQQSLLRVNFSIPYLQTLITLLPLAFVASIPHSLLLFLRHLGAANL